MKHVYVVIDEGWEWFEPLAVFSTKRAAEVWIAGRILIVERVPLNPPKGAA